MESVVAIYMVLEPDYYLLIFLYYLTDCSLYPIYAHHVEIQVQVADAEVVGCRDTFANVFLLSIEKVIFQLWQFIRFDLKYLVIFSLSYFYFRTFAYIFFEFIIQSIVHTIFRHGNPSTQRGYGLQSEFFYLSGPALDFDI